MNSDRSLQIAYAAGFFDGEGHIRIQRHSVRGSYMLSVSVVQATPDPLDLFITLFGGVTKRRLVPYKGSLKCQYQWQTSSKSAELVLRELLPFLRCKKAEAELALEFRATFRPQFGDRSKNSPELEEARRVAMIALQDMRKDKRQGFLDRAIQENGL
jgi:hypothetical protein